MGCLKKAKQTTRDGKANCKNQFFCTGHQCHNPIIKTNIRDIYFKSIPDNYADI